MIPAGSDRKSQKKFPLDNFFEKFLIKIQLHMKINYGSPHAKRFFNDYLF